jgi:hypothetical protein
MKTMIMNGQISRKAQLQVQHPPAAEVDVEGRLFATTCTLADTGKETPGAAPDTRLPPPAANRMELQVPVVRVTACVLVPPESSGMTHST